MDLWIRADSERTVAGVMAVIAVLLPWDITYIPDIAGGSLLYVRFPLFEFQYAMGIQVVDPVIIRSFVAAAEFHSGPLALAFQSALIGGVLTIVVGVLGVSMLVTEDSRNSNLVVRLLGLVMGVAGLAFFVAWILVLTKGAAGIDIPVGAIVTPVLGGVLVAAERR